MGRDDLTRVLEEVAEFVNLLIEDATSCAQKGRLYEHARESAPDQFWGRMLIRCFFTAVEGFSAGAKRMAVAALHAREIQLTPEEERLLTTEEVYLTDKGKVRTRDRRPSTRATLRHSLDLFARFSGASHPTDLAGAGFQAIDQGLKVRDRITHPRSKDDVEITWSDIDVIKDAAAWLGGEVNRFAGDLRSKYEKTPPNVKGPSGASRP